MKDGRKIVNFDRLGKLVLTDSQSTTPGTIEIIRNQNELLVQSLDFVDKQIKMISAITGIPLYAFGLQQEGGQDSGTSKIKSAGLFYKKIELLQDSIRKIFINFWELFQIPESERVLEFNEITTTDPLHLIVIAEKKLQNGITSKVRAIMSTEGVSKEEAETIYKEIILENKLNSNDSNIGNQTLTNGGI